MDIRLERKKVERLESLGLQYDIEMVKFAIEKGWNGAQCTNLFFEGILTIMETNPNHDFVLRTEKAMEKRNDPIAYVYLTMIKTAREVFKEENNPKKLMTCATVITPLGY